MALTELGVSELLIHHALITLMAMMAESAWKSFPPLHLHLRPTR